MNYLIPDLNKVVISYMDTETYKKLKLIYPKELSDSKIDELNLLSCISYSSLLKLVSIYNNKIVNSKQNRPNNKIDAEYLLFEYLENYNCSNLDDILYEYEQYYKSQDLYSILFKDNIELHNQFLNKIGRNCSERLLVMLNIRDKILKNEPDIYETTDPKSYINIIEKYLIEEMKK
jgi:hypothetical protein